MKLVECVPNFSEGRDAAKIEAITEAVCACEGVALLDVDPGKDTNRTVVTFLGAPEAVLEAAFRAIARAAQLIDMSQHHGAHARMGATDVCPFVPVQDVSMAECVELARRLGARVAAELGVPVFLYEEAASRPERRNLATIREGEYEGLAAKLALPEWAPDFGRAEFNPRAGATVIGAREFLIAYNFNLNTRDSKIAHDIALEIREAGRTTKDAGGKSVKVAGKFKHVKAVGWYMENFQCAQISMNLTNYRATPLATVFDEVCRLAEARGVRCTGSELVGLAPKDCLLEAGRHFLRKAGKSAGVPERELIRVAVQSLGLAELGPFDPAKKIVEARIPDPRPLAGLSVQAFADETSSDSPAPGGGSVAAVCGALSAALAAMVAQLSVGKKGYEAVAGPMKALAEAAQPLKDACLRAIDDDTAAFDGLMAAMKLPRKTEEQKAAREAAVQAATRRAIAVPLSLLGRMPEVLALAAQAGEQGNQNSLSDAGVAVLCARAAAEGAYYNVVINLAGVSDAAWRAATLAEARALVARVREQADAASRRVEGVLLQRAGPPV
ncbi:MAG TPA: glutamate formimidoyltransferase [Myxococcota bacterium]|nr:glutamate formimidoyltransferase [Myxococcota bacterium]HRY94332.1 glutamate formimidoyltransferase [Myxococcota bacterium]HSA21213.1 glutamate formimidoyltransferase [Myxococcota bacterium]